jgi:cytoskeleton protein RodZ
MTTLGQELKKYREERGLSLQQVADRTLIGIQFLKAIEADDYGPLPGGIFNRAFVRKFAHEVGLEEPTALRLYEEQLAAQGGEEDRRFELGVENWDRPPTYGSGFVLSLIVLVVLAGGSYLAYRFFFREALAPTVPSATQTGTVNDRSASIDPTPTPAPPSSSSEELRDLRLAVAVGASACWIKVTRDREVPEEALLPPGATREYLAQERLVLSAGNLPSLRLTLNGRPLLNSKIANSPTSVVVTSLVLTKETYLQYADAPPPDFPR